MCLAIIQNRFEPTQEIGIGYKIFDIYEGNTKYYQSMYMSNKYVLNEWYIASPNEERTYRGEYYTTGFHILTDLEEAKRFLDLVLADGYGKPTLVKVEYSHARLEGKDGTFGDIEEFYGIVNANCIVADRMKILGEIDDEGDLIEL